MVGDFSKFLDATQKGGNHHHPRTSSSCNNGNPITNIRGISRHHASATSTGDAWEQGAQPPCEGNRILCPPQQTFYGGGQVALTKNNSVGDRTHLLLRLPLLLSVLRQWTNIIFWLLLHSPCHGWEATPQQLSFGKPLMTFPRNAARRPCEGTVYHQEVALTSS